MITQENYEIYFTDYLDGILKETEIAELKAFLLVHPALSELLEDIENIKLQKPALTYSYKELLKKTEIQECPDYYAIAAAEKVLTKSEKQQLGKRLAEKNFRMSVLFYQKLRLKPNLDIQFNQKNKLYRKKNKHLIFIRLGSIAALLIVFFLIRLYIPQSIEKSSVNSNKRITILPLVVSPAYSTSLTIECRKQTFELADVRTVKKMRQSITPIPSSTEILALLPLPEEAKLQETAMNISPEMILTESAKVWKSSFDNVETKNIFTSVIHAGRNLTQKIKKTGKKTDTSVTN